MYLPLLLFDLRMKCRPLISKIKLCMHIHHQSLIVAGSPLGKSSAGKLRSQQITKQQTSSRSITAISN